MSNEPAVRIITPTRIDHGVTGGVEVVPLTRSAQKKGDHLPQNTQRARAGRERAFRLYCEAHHHGPNAQNALANYTAYLIDGGMKSTAASSYVASVRAWREREGHPVDPKENERVQRILQDAVQAEADTPELTPLPVGAAAVKLREIMAMLDAVEGQHLARLREPLAGVDLDACVRALARLSSDDLLAEEPSADDAVEEALRAVAALLLTAKPAIARAARDSLALCVHWHGAFRAEETVRLFYEDFTWTSEEVQDRPYDVLSLRLRRSKSDQKARGKTKKIYLTGLPERVDPRAAWIIWSLLLLIRRQELTGPVLRPIDQKGRIGVDAKVRRPKHDTGSITPTTFRTLWSDAAASAGLHEKVTDTARAQRRREDAAVRAAAAAAPDEESALRIIAEHRLARRAVREAAPRYTPHGGRRGNAQELDDRGASADAIRAHLGHAPGSATFEKHYRDNAIPAEETATIHLIDGPRHTPA